MKSGKSIVWFVGLCLLFMPIYCNAESLQYQASKEVEAGLKTGELAGEFDFYFSGSQAEPHTIIAVLKGVPFYQSLWQKSDSTPKTIQRWYELIDNPHRFVQDHYFGGYILDDTGRKVGLWYSKYRFRQAEFNGEGLLAISRPFRKDNMPGRSRRRGILR